MLLASRPPFSRTNHRYRQEYPNDRRIFHLASACTLVHPNIHRLFESHRKLPIVLVVSILYLYIIQPYRREFIPPPPRFTHAHIISPLPASSSRPASLTVFMLLVLPPSLSLIIFFTCHSPTLSESPRPHSLSRFTPPLPRPAFASRPASLAPHPR